jgi:hypothetical protein
LLDRPASPFNLSTHLKGYLNFHGRAPVARIFPANLFSRLTPTGYNGPSLTVSLIPLPQLPIACFLSGSFSSNPQRNLISFCSPHCFRTTLSRAHSPSDFRLLIFFTIAHFTRSSV